MLNELQKMSLAEKISSQFDYCEVTMSKHGSEIRSIKGTFEIRFPSRNERKSQGGPQQGNGGKKS